MSLLNSFLAYFQKPTMSPDSDQPTSTLATSPLPIQTNPAAANRVAFLDTIAYSELGRGLLAVSDDGYNVLVGSTAASPHLFDSYADHPRKLVQVRPGLYSTAAGRYQLLARYFDAYKAELGLSDFSPAAQDAIALQQLKEQRALPLIDAGDFDSAVAACANIWASLPGAGYGQHENPLDALRQIYVNAGGMLA